MNDLYSVLQATQRGTQAGNAATQGMVPNAQQATGSPQLYIQAVGALRKIVSDLGTVQAGLYRQAGTDDVMHSAIQRVMKSTQELQAVSTDLQKHMKELAGNQAGQAPQGSQQPQLSQAPTPPQQGAM